MIASIVTEPIVRKAWMESPSNLRHGEGLSKPCQRWEQFQEKSGAGATGYPVKHFRSRIRQNLDLLGRVPVSGDFGYGQNALKCFTTGRGSGGVTPQTMKARQPVSSEIIDAPATRQRPRETVVDRSTINDCLIVISRLFLRPANHDLLVRRRTAALGS
jgi:hypothetical protein